MLGLYGLKSIIITGLVLIGIAGLNFPAFAQSLDHPLKPPATGSPRATLFGFIFEMNRAFQLGNSEDGDSTVALVRAVRSLNLSKLPPRLAEDQGIVAAFKLKEILDRIDLPTPEAVPGPDENLDFNQNDKNGNVLKK